jgi:two-component system sensor histidine kinase KdpD
MSRIEGGILQARVQGVDLDEVLTGAIDRTVQQWPGIRFSSTLAMDATVVRADPVFLDRVVANLLDNAAKAALGAGRPDIEVRTARDDGRVVVRIADHGAGVPPSVREQLFYPFYRLGERHPRLGTGLGLPICKGFLSRMDGEIWVEDTPGGGSTFAFSLPASESPR